MVVTIWVWSQTMICYFDKGGIQLIVNWPWGAGSFRLAWEKSTVRVRLVLPRRGWLWACGRRVSWVTVRRSQTCERLPRKPWCVPAWFPTTDRPFYNQQNTSNTISAKQKHHLNFASVQRSEKFILQQLRPEFQIFVQYNPLKSINY